MGKAWSHSDHQTDDAAERIYEAIWTCRAKGIPDHKIISALVGELHGLTSDGIEPPITQEPSREELP